MKEEQEEKKERELEGTKKTKDEDIYTLLECHVNGIDIDPFNPFNEKNFATIKHEPFEHQYQDSTIRIQSYILPHKTKVNLEEWEKYEGKGGYTKNQGFYVYRANRLIIDGGWMGLTNSSNLSDLARIEINVPVSVDEEWQTDVKKSSLQLPPLIKAKLRNLIKLPKKKSRRRAWFHFRWSR